jgi:2,3-bisphosphoglycerate-dependent phosphoglycerate mutase
MEATRIIAIRHGETAWNVDTRIQGQLDIPLNDTGRRQANRLAAALADEPVAAIYSSDLGRAHETASAIGAARGVEVVAHTGLRERSFGMFQGRTFAEIDATWPEEAQAWRKRIPEWAPEGGESLVQLRDRITSVAGGLAQQHVGEQIVLVAHGGVLDMLYRAATGQDLHAPRTWQLGNAAINRLLWTPDGFTLVGWADEQHLSDEAIDETTA